MINGEPGCLAGSSPTPFSLSRQQVVSLSRSSSVSPVELTDGRGRGMGWGMSQKAWSSINLSIIVLLYINNCNIRLLVCLLSPPRKT
jgi:hypothetical protein